MGYGRGAFDAFHILGIIVWGMASLVALLIVVGVLILLVRYLLVATKSHQLYLANNSPTVAESPIVADEPAPGPAPRTRTPKAPPAV